MTLPAFASLVVGHRQFFLSGATRPVAWRKTQAQHDPMPLVFGFEEGGAGWVRAILFEDEWPGAQATMHVNARRCRCVEFGQKSGHAVALQCTGICPSRRDAMPG